MDKSICSKIFQEIDRGKLDKFKLLDKINLHKCFRNGRNPLHEACFQGEYSIVKTLLDMGFDPNERDEEGNLPIHLAFCNGNYEVVKLLIERGADPNMRDINGFTLLHKAYYLGLESLIDFIVRNGGKMDVLDSFGRRPYEYKRS
ncbi:MAG: ankyrin repeat domain-containing protein [Metallosphaera sp.]|uniref:ankyrin repeat domain-containing protein n=1 Tax=Metallosphaera TaxID=41980 RepID=UPI00068C07F9|nr:ankyrin repeat domain-containing protein [Metallosphaera cuprina]